EEKATEKELTVDEAIKQVEGVKGKKTVVSGTKDKNGDVVLVVRDQNGKTQTQRRDFQAGVVTEPNGAQHGRPDTSVITIEGDDGQEASYDPKSSEFDGSNPSRVPGKPDKRDTAHSREGFELARDSKGRGSGSVTGDGDLHDGASNTTVHYTPDKQSTRNTASFEGGGNDQFVSQCKGPCKWSAPNPKNPKKRDTFKGFGPSTTIVGSNGKTGAQIKFEGKGEFTDGRLGEKIRAFDNSIRNNDLFKKTTGPDANPFSSIITRDKNGNGGQYHLATGQLGAGKIYKSDGHYYNVKLGQGYPVSNSGIPVSRYDIRRLKVSTPDNKGKGGTLDCLGTCTVAG
ncbi:MAG: hypothetical protein ACRDXB_21705, partial [Actinomycetes bacterium]